jgi:hypothetical protein
VTFCPQLELKSGAVVRVTGKDGDVQCQVYCWSWANKELQDALDSDPQLKARYGTVTVLYNALLHAALCWGSNRQSPNPALRGRPCSTSQSSGNAGIINGYDQECMVKVGTGR